MLYPFQNGSNVNSRQPSAGESYPHFQPVFAYITHPYNHVSGCPYSLLSRDTPCSEVIVSGALET